MMTFDVVVIGLGAMGSAARVRASPGAAAASSASTDMRRAMTAAPRMAPPASSGSAISSIPSYVPLLRAAYPLWRELAAKSGLPLLNITGIVEIGAPDSELVAGTLRASRQHGLAHEVLDARRR